MPYDGDWMGGPLQNSSWQLGSQYLTGKRSGIGKKSLDELMHPEDCIYSRWDSCLSDQNNRNSLLLPLCRQLESSQYTIEVDKLEQGGRSTILWSSHRPTNGPHWAKYSENPSTFFLISLISESGYIWFNCTMAPSALSSRQTCHSKKYNLSWPATVAYPLCSQICPVRKSVESRFRYTEQMLSILWLRPSRLQHDIASISAGCAHSLGRMVQHAMAC